MMHNINYHAIHNDVTVWYHVIIYCIISCISRHDITSMSITFWYHTYGNISCTLTVWCDIIIHCDHVYYDIMHITAWYHEYCIIQHTMILWYVWYHNLMISYILWAMWYRVIIQCMISYILLHDIISMSISTWYHKYE